uniref:Uncharacterized protein n=1 Tax=Anopheles atroparvus TaxID=41427 RepID=A0A182JAJ7_ANOAO
MDSLRSSVPCDGKGGGLINGFLSLPAGEGSDRERVSVRALVRHDATMSRDIESYRRSRSPKPLPRDDATVVCPSIWKVALLHFLNTRIPADWDANGFDATVDRVALREGREAIAVTPLPAAEERPAVSGSEMGRDTTGRSISDVQLELVVDTVVAPIPPRSTVGAASTAYRVYAGRVGLGGMWDCGIRVHKLATQQAGTM